MAQPLEELVDQVLSGFEGGVTPSAQALTDLYATQGIEAGRILAHAQLLRFHAPDLERVGTYRIVRRLGRGATADVFVAKASRASRRVPVGTEVAVKVLLPHALTAPSAVDRFVREARIAARVSSPHVVRMLDLGLTDDGELARPYLVMELVDGMTLARAIATQGARPDAVCRAWLLSILRGLAAIHAAGAVHRDVKPANVVLAGDGRPRLLDLGIAWLGDDVARGATHEGFVGTPGYAAPEQLLGEPALLGPQTDLYGAGAVVFEALTGRAPPAPGRALEFGPHGTAFLRRVLQGLLDPDPDTRPREAHQIAERVERGESGAWWRGRGRNEPCIDDPAPIDRVVGFLTSPPEPRQPALLLVGPRGSGKRSMVAAAADSAAALGRRSTIVRIRCALGAFQGEHEILRQALESTRAQSPEGRAALADGGSRLDELGGVGLPRSAADLRLTRIEALAALAAEETTVVVVEDADIGDPRGMELVLVLADLLGEAGAHVVVTWNDDDRTPPSDAPPFASIVHVAPLDEPGRWQPQSDRSSQGRHDSREPDVVDRKRHLLRHAAGGSPLTAELLREVARRSSLDEACAEPRGTDDVVAELLASIPRAERAVYEAASLIGLQFSWDTAVAAARTCGALGDEASPEPAARWLIEASKDRWEFRHDAIRRAVRATVAERRARDLHAALAHRFAAGAAADPWCGVRACVHAVAGNVPEVFHAWFLPTVHALRQASAFSDVVALVRLALRADGPIDDAERRQALRAVVFPLESLRRFEEMRAALDELRALAQEAADAKSLAFAETQTVSILIQSGDAASAATRLEECLARATAADDVESQASVHALRGWLAADRADVPAARAALDRALDLAVRHGLPEIEITTRLLVADLELGARRYEIAEGEYERVARLGRRLGLPACRARGEGGIGVAACRAGRFDAAQRILQDAVRRCAIVGDRVGADCFRNELGDLALRQGDLATALGVFEQQARRAVEFGNARVEALRLFNLGRVLMQLGRGDEALSALDRCVLASRSVGALDGVALAEQLALEVAHMRGEPPEVLADAYLALAPRFRTAGLGDRVPALELRAARLRADTGDEESARDLVRALLAGERGPVARKTRAFLEVLGARVGVSDAATAQRTVESVWSTLGHRERLVAALGLWRVTRERAWLEAAVAGVEALVERAPPQDRAALVDRVPLYRDVRAAAAAARDSSD